jgi:hypothetical protein
MLEELDLAEALLGFGLGFVGAAEILALLGFDPVALFLFHDHGVLLL